MTTRRLTTRQLTAALADIDTQLDGLRDIEAMFNALPATGVDEVADAWNATHDAIRCLEEHRDWVASNPRPITAAGAGTWELVQQNID